MLAKYNPIFLYLLYCVISFRSNHLVEILRTVNAWERNHSVFFVFFFNFQQVNPFQPGVAFYIETSHIFCCAKQMTGFYMKRDTGLKWIKYFVEHFQTLKVH